MLGSLEVGTAVPAKGAPVCCTHGEVHHHNAIQPAEHLLFTSFLKFHLLYVSSVFFHQEFIRAYQLSPRATLHGMAVAVVVPRSLDALACQHHEAAITCLSERGSTAWPRLTTPRCSRKGLMRER